MGWFNYYASVDDRIEFDNITVYFQGMSKRIRYVNK